MRSVRSLIAPFALLVATVAVSSPALASSPYAPLDRPGPKLSVKTSTLKAALQCSGNFKSKLEPILLNPATGVTVDENYAWNYERAFTAQKRPWCALHMPSHTLGDIQVAGEYLVYGIRTMHAKSHRKIAIMGHSQGGMSMRWALRFWPDTRPMVDDVIGMAGSNHGTTVATPCRPGFSSCMPAVWQQASTSQFIKALNSGAETFKGISYTELFTHTDEVVQPNNTDATSSSALHTGKGAIANISTQDVCPLDTNEHLAIGTIDSAAYALAIDALNHPGPAMVSRIDPAVCTQPFQPGVDPANAAMYMQILSGIPGLASVGLPFANLVGAPETADEPPLRCYTKAKRC